METVTESRDESRSLYCATCLADLSGAKADSLDSCQNAGHRILPIARNSIIAEFGCGCIVHDGKPAIQRTACLIHEHAESLLRAARAVVFTTELTIRNGSLSVAARLALDRLRAAVGRSDGTGDAS